ncbi:hypothetical protein ACNTMW_00605 [Planosporangium sp. 12N6]|uniref:hypothetical protein n=1 Tax=Planosporangium spinosum TaxID=3402278 RepID=UPI003CF062FC
MTRLRAGIGTSAVDDAATAGRAAAMAALADLTTREPAAWPAGFHNATMAAIAL